MVPCVWPGSTLNRVLPGRSRSTDRCGPDLFEVMVTVSVVGAAFDDGWVPLAWAEPLVTARPAAEAVSSSAVAAALERGCMSPCLLWFESPPVRNSKRHP